MEVPDEEMDLQQLTMEDTNFLLFVFLYFIYGQADIFYFKEWHISARKCQNHILPVL